MQSQRILPASTNFEKICDLAMNEDKAGLIALVNEGVNLGEFVGTYNPVMLLAKQGKDKAVKFLLDEFHLSRTHAVRGFAEGGHFAQMESQISLGASMAFAIYGLGLGGSSKHIEKIEALVQRGGNRTFAGSGLGYFGDLDAAKKQVQAGAAEHLVVYGAARAGRYEDVKKLLASANMNGVFVEQAICGFASGNHNQWLNEFKTLHGNFLNLVVFAFARAGDDEQVEQYLIQGASIDAAVEGYARGGHVKQVDKLLLRGAAIEKALKGYAHNDFIPQVNALLARASNVYHGNDLIKQTLCAFIEMYQLTREGLLFRMTMVDNVHLRCGIAEATLHSFDKNSKEYKEETEDAKYTRIQNELRELLRKAKRLSEIMQKCQVNFTQAQALMVKGARAWLLNGSKLVNANFPSDIFHHISSYVTGLPDEDIRKIHDVVNRQLRDHTNGTQTETPRGLFGLFSKAITAVTPQFVVDAKMQAAEQRYQQRKAYK